MAMDLNISTKFYSGTIVPRDFFGRQSLDTITQEAQEMIAAQYQGVESITRYFESYDEAREWLLTVDAPEASIPAPTHTLVSAQAAEATAEAA